MALIDASRSVPGDLPLPPQAVKPAAAAVADHQGPRSENRDQPPAEVGDPPAERVERRPVERDTRIPRSRRPIALDNDQADDESSYSISSWSPQGKSLSQTLRKLKPFPTVWRLSSNRWLILRSRRLLRWLTWRWSPTSWPLPANPS